MVELALRQPELIGRDEELSKLKKSLDNAIAGKGSTIFISGEAGIGKTRLVSELIKEAESKDAQVIQGWCLAESLEPLMPIKTALREAGLFHLISGDPPPLVVSTYLMNNAGLLIAKAEKEELDLDPYIFTSMLNAVGNFVKDSMQMVDQVERTGGLNILGYKEFKIIIEEYEGLHMASVTKGSLSEFLVSDMRDVLSEVQRTYENVLTDWDGDIDKVEGVENIVSQLVTSGKYDGKFLVDDPKIRQENLFDNLLLGVQRLSSDKTTLLFLDDLQWVDPSTLSLLHYLSRNTSNNKVSIVGAYRPEDIVQSWDGKTHQLETAMQNMSRDDLLEKMELGRLGSTDTEKIVESTLGKVSFEKSFYNKIYKETEGTPFFVLEVVKLLVEEGCIAQDEKSVWRLVTDIEKLDIPSKVYNVVKRRLDRLMEEQRKILDWASVFGEEFKSDVVGKVMKLERLQLLENLSKIEKTHKLIHYLKDKYRFDHTKIRDVLYNGIGEELRREYHRIVGDTIAELHKNKPDKVLSDLVYHYTEARDDRAAKYLIKAGDLAKKKFNNEEAIRFYVEALEFLKDRGKSNRIIEENLGDIYLLKGEFELAIDNYLSSLQKGITYTKKAELRRKIAEVYNKNHEYEKCIKECDKGLKHLKKEDPETYYDQRLKRRIYIETARLLRVKGRAIMLTGDYKKARELFFESLRIAEKFKDKKETAQAHNNLGVLYEEKFEHEGMQEAFEHYEKALKIREGIGDALELSETLHHMACIYHNSASLYGKEGAWEKSLGYLEKSLEIKRKIGDKSGIAVLLSVFAARYRSEGEFEKALECSEESLDIGKRIGALVGIAYPLGMVGNVYRDMGELGKALEYFQQSLEIMKKAKNKRGIEQYFSAIGTLYETMGKLDEALECYEQCLKLSKEIPDKRFLVENLYQIGNLYRLKGDLDKALEYHNKSIKKCLEIDSTWILMANYHSLCKLYLEQGNTQTAHEHAERALEISVKIGSIKHKSLSHQVLGMVHREMNEWDKAIQDFDKVRVILQDKLLTTEPWVREKLAQWFYEYALLFKAKGEPDKAKKHLEKALSEFERMGMKLWAEKCRKALADL